MEFLWSLISGMELLMMYLVYLHEQVHGLIVIWATVGLHEDGSQCWRTCLTQIKPETWSSALPKSWLENLAEWRDSVIWIFWNLFWVWREQWVLQEGRLVEVKVEMEVRDMDSLNATLVMQGTEIFLRLWAWFKYQQNYRWYFYFCLSSSGPVTSGPISHHSDCQRKHSGRYLGGPDGQFVYALILQKTDHLWSQQITCINLLIFRFT